MNIEECPSIMDVANATIAAQEVLADPLARPEERIEAQLKIQLYQALMLMPWAYRGYAA